MTIKPEEENDSKVPIMIPKEIIPYKRSQQERHEAFPQSVISPALLALLELGGSNIECQDAQ